MEPNSCILVVEDDDIIRESLADTLRDEGFTVAEAANGRRALDWLGKNPQPCIILLDIFMPVMNGVDFRQRQLQDPELSKIPVIVVSAISAGTEPDLQPLAYLQKPIDLDRLLGYVRQYC